MSAAWLDGRPPAEFFEQPRSAIAVTDVPQCPVCDAKEFDLLTVGYDYEILTCLNPWRFVECRSCGHVWLNPRPATSALSTIYPSSYYAYDTAKTINPIALWGKALLDTFKLRKIFQALARPLTSFLDIGCGSGQYLRVAERRGVARDPIKAYFWFSLAAEAGDGKAADGRARIGAGLDPAARAEAERRLARWRKRYPAL